ncbi:MAG: O-antigen ligase family protein [Bacillota bacterium]
MSVDAIYPLFGRVVLVSGFFRFIAFLGKCLRQSLISQTVRRWWQLGVFSVKLFSLYWEQSFAKSLANIISEMIDSLKSGLNAFELSRWKVVLEPLIVILVVLMPALNSWGLLLPVLILGELSNPRKTGHNELVSLWLVMAVSAVFSGGLRPGIKDLTVYAVWIGMAILVAKGFSPNFSARIIWALVWSSPLWMGIGFLQQWAGVPTPPGWLSSEQSLSIAIRSYSLFQNPNIFALFLLCILALAVDLADNYRGRAKFSLFFIIALDIISLYFTYSRGAWLIGGLFLSVWLGRKLGKRAWLVIPALFLMVLMLNPVRVRMLSLLTFSDPSFWYRLRIWEGAIRALPHYLIWGGGPGSFGRIYPWYQMGNTIGAHAHQLFLQLWLENGLFTLVFFSYIIVKTVRDFRCYPNPGKAVVLILAIFFGYGFLETWTQSRLLGGYFWFFLGMAFSFRPLAKYRF